MNTENVITIDNKVTALRNPRKEPINDFQLRAAELNYRLHIGDLVQPRKVITNHGSIVS